jgi:hypothetical protein
LGGGKHFLLIVIQVQREHALLDVVLALRAAGRLAGCLNGWKQESDEDADDGNDDQQFDEREGGRCPPLGFLIGTISSLVHR